MSGKTPKKTRTTLFKKGNKVAVGNKGGGRPPDWFKAKMAELASSKDAIEFLEGAIKGDAVDEFLVLQTGVQVPVKPDATTRLKVIAHCADRGYGKSPQGVEVSGKDGQPLVIHVVKYGD